MTIMALLSDVWLRLSMTIRPIKTRTLNDYDILPDKAPGGTLEFEDCLVVPASNGIHDGNGRPILASHLQRGAPDAPIFPYGIPAPVEINANDPSDQMECAIILPPLIIGHFGHRLTETAGWLSDLLDTKTRLHELVRTGTPVVIMGNMKYQVNQVPAMTKLFDIPANQVLLAQNLSRPMRCKKILLPQPTMVDCRAMDETHLQASFSMMNRWHGINPIVLRERMKGMTEDAGLRSGKIYLSRTKMPDNFRKVIGEDRIENELDARGWKIIHPETLPIQDQLLALHHARVIGGNVGSAMHTLMYLGFEAKGKTVIGLGTDRVENERYGWIYNFVNQFRLQGIEFHHLSCFDFCDSTSKQKLLDSMRFFDLKPLYGPKRIARTMDRIAHQALSPSPPKIT